MCGAQATGAISHSNREAQANLAASANLLILVLAARRDSRSVPAQRSKDRHAPYSTPSASKSTVVPQSWIKVIQ